MECLRKHRTAITVRAVRLHSPSEQLKRCFEIPGALMDLPGEQQREPLVGPIVEPVLLEFRVAGATRRDPPPASSGDRVLTHDAFLDVCRDQNRFGRDSGGPWRARSRWGEIPTTPGGFGHTATLGISCSRSANLPHRGSPAPTEGVPATDQTRSNGTAGRWHRIGPAVRRPIILNVAVVAGVECFSQAAAGGCRFIRTHPAEGPNPRHDFPATVRPRSVPPKRFRTRSRRLRSRRHPPPLRLPALTGGCGPYRRGVHWSEAPDSRALVRHRCRDTTG